MFYSFIHSFIHTYMLMTPLKLNRDSFEGEGEKRRVERERERKLTETM